MKSRQRLVIWKKEKRQETYLPLEQTLNEETVDWTSVFEICKLVSQNKPGAKEARKLLQKKMMDNNPRIQMTSLEVSYQPYKVPCCLFLFLKIMNALIENDWRTMQTEVTAKSFGEDLCRLASSKVFE